MRTHRETDRLDETNSRFSQCCKLALKRIDITEIPVRELQKYHYLQRRSGLTPSSMFTSSSLFYRILYSTKLTRIVSALSNEHVYM
jgi:hypothetical protein